MTHQLWGDSAVNIPASVAAMGQGAETTSPQPSRKNPWGGKNAKHENLPPNTQELADFMNS